MQKIVVFIQTFFLFSSISFGSDTTEGFPNFGNIPNPDQLIEEGELNQTNELGFPWLPGVPFPIRTRRVEECGIDYYAFGTGEVCGPLRYKNRESPACPPRRYKSGQSLLCWGSIPPRIERATEFGFFKKGEEVTLRAKCPEGRTPIGDHIITTVWISPDDSIHMYRAELDCSIPALLKSCELPEFGVATYWACEHESHGVETFKSCNHPSFGKVYNTCKIRANTKEIQNYLNYLNSALAEKTNSLIKTQSEYFLSMNQDTNLYCLIHKYDKDPLYDEIITDLKSLYREKNGKSFENQSIECIISSNPVTPSIPDDQYLPCDSDTACTARSRYLQNKFWFEDHLKVLDNLLDDVVAKQDVSVKDQLQIVSTLLKDKIE